MQLHILDKSQPNLLISPGVEMMVLVHVKINKNHYE